MLHAFIKAMTPSNLEIGKRRKVFGNDEHNQPLWIRRRIDGYYWYFAQLPVSEQEINGPFTTEAEAIKDANEYMNQGAP